MKKIISFILVIAILCSTGITSFAVAGEGSAINPYLVETAEDVIAISDDLTAHYKLAANIDMSTVAGFYPIGNSRDGAFTGSIDGNGYKISNLSIVTPREKYTGFIGYNEGTIKNLILENVYVEGDRYTGTVTGYNSTESSITNCSVSGTLLVEESSTVSLNVGGAIGYNAGSTEDITCNVDIKVLPLDSSYGNIYIGGGVGCNINSVKNLDFSGDIEFWIANDVYIESVLYIGGGVAYNSGNIYDISSSEKIMIKNNTTYYGELYIGGVTAYNSGTSCFISSSGEIKSEGTRAFTKNTYLAGVVAYNIGVVESMSNGSSIKFYCPIGGSNCVGGYIGYNKTSEPLNIRNAINAADILIADNSSARYINSNVGGLVGFSGSELNIENSLNTANISFIEKYFNTYSSHDNIGGIVGCFNNGSVSGCINTGNITVEETYRAYAGGIVGYTGNGKVEKCYNSGNIKVDAYDDDYNTHSFAAGIAGSCPEALYCVNAGTISSYGWDYSEAYGISDQYVEFSLNIGPLNSRVGSGTAFEKGGNYNVTLNSQTEYSYKKRIQEISDADINNIWLTDSNINNGYPYPTYIDNMPLLNISVKDMTLGETFTLRAFRNGEPAPVLSWSSDYTSVASVNNNGYVRAVKSGSTFITATLPDGMKATCYINVYASPEINPEMSDLTLNINNTVSVKAISNTSDEYVDEVISSNPEVCSVVLSYEGITNSIKITGVSEGTATITVTTVFGTVKKFNVTVTNNANAISLPSSHKINRGDSYRLNVTLNPPDAVSKLTWISSNEDIVSVDENGVLTGNNSGTTMVSVMTDNGYVASCNVTVVAPVKSFSFESNPLVLVKGSKGYINAIPDPIDTTDTITYSSSNTSYATVSSSTGLVTAVKAGSATITAKSSSGVIGQCPVIIEEQSIPAESITLNRNSVYLKGDETQVLSAALAPANATDKRVVWSVADPSIASVSDNGVVTGLASGTTIVTASDYDKTVFAECTVTVVIDVTGVYIDVSEIQLNESESRQLTATIEPVGATNPNVSWDSSDESVATVNKNGVVTAISAGSATITVTTEDWAKTATCTVTVIRPIAEFEISRKSASVVRGEKLQLSVDFAPLDATFTEFAWSSSNPSVASVDENGCVSTLKSGNTIITVTNGKGNTATCRIRVTPDTPAIEIYNFSHSYEQKLDLFDSYSDAKMKLGFHSYNCEDAVRFEWSSSNRRVKIDKNGNITNTGFFGRSSTITIKAIDAQGKVIARKSVKVMFYKLQWQKDRLQSQSIVSDSFLNRNLSPQALEASSENELVAVFSVLLEFFKRTFKLLRF